MKTIHPITQVFLDFAKTHKDVNFEIRQDSGLLDPNGTYEVKAGSNLSTAAQQLMERRGTIGGTELDQMLLMDKVLGSQETNQRGASIFTHDGGTTHPDTWMQRGRTDEIVQNHSPIIQILALQLPEGKSNELFSELSGILKDRGLAGTFERRTMLGHEQHTAGKGIKANTYPDAISVTVHTSVLGEPAPA